MTRLIELKAIRRINVVGYSGSGKSTFSKTLAQLLQAPYLEIDRIFWGPNWTETPDNEFFEKLEVVLASDNWVLDGNYKRTTPIKWKNVQLVIWLDYSFWRTFMRAVKRALGRIATQEEIWAGTGNKESLKMLLSKDSIVLWTLKTYRTNRKDYSEAITDKNYAYIRFIRLTSPKETRDFLKQVEESASV